MTKLNYKKSLKTNSRNDTDTKLPDNPLITKNLFDMNYAAAQNKNHRFSAIYTLVFCSGMAALSWTVVWQIQSSLALGVSAWGAALTLAVTMAGMCIGALLAGLILKNKREVNALRIYGILELLIGLAGIFLIPALHIAERMDTQAYTTMDQAHYLVHVTGIVLSMGFPAVCMGATTPVFGLAARQHNTSISILYGLNTLGAAAGSLLAAFILIPLLGVKGTIYTIAAVNFLVGAVAIAMGKKAEAQAEENKNTLVDKVQLQSWQEYLLVFVTGFSTLALEVAWFRSFTAAFWSTTAAFAIMLSSVLLSLGLAAQIAPLLRKKQFSLSTITALAGVFILLATPLVERFDLISATNSVNSFTLFAKWFSMSFLATVIPITLLGVGLPWVLDSQYSPRRWASLYGFNTLASVIGSIIAGWLLLPTIGFARTAWCVGVLVFLTGLIFVNRPAKVKIKTVIVGLAALIFAIGLESGVGKSRVQILVMDPSNQPIILANTEGPDATVSVIQFPKGKEKALVIDGFIATSQASFETGSELLTQYMLWMGSLPMLLHPEPHKGLVICFGTGQTANALRKENPKSLTIVDINPNVFNMAHHFESNERVLEDPRVNHLVMDGRAFLRRTQEKFDVITLEPMPPTFAGVNALYSKEFYELAKQKMTEKGIIAQWLPYHLLSPYHAASISRTFNDVFPNSILWIDPQSLTGILLGTKRESGSLGDEFPGFERNAISRLLPDETVSKAVYLEREGLKKYSLEFGTVITDDNQLLSYGSANTYTHGNLLEKMVENYEALKTFKQKFYQDQNAELENFEKLENPRKQPKNQ